MPARSNTLYFSKKPHTDFRPRLTRPYEDPVGDDEGAESASSNDAAPNVVAVVVCQDVSADEQQYITLSRAGSAFTLYGAERVMSPGTVPLSLYVCLAAGRAIGKRGIKCHVIGPSGQWCEVISEEFVFSGADQSVAYCRKGIPIAGEGLHWIDVLANDAILTRVPLQVKYKQKEEQ